jgi:hypothetical protein
MLLNSISGQSAPGGVTAAQAKVTIRGQQGYLFKSTTLNSYCFVPVACIYLEAEGRVEIDEGRYFLSGWSMRNMLLGCVETEGRFLFPDPEQLVSDLSNPEVQPFLRRLDPTWSPEGASSP